MWDRETGKPYTSIEATADFNDLCLYKQSGLLFLANEQPKMQVRRYRDCSSWPTNSLKCRYVGTGYWFWPDRFVIFWPPGSGFIIFYHGLGPSFYVFMPIQWMIINLFMFGILIPLESSTFTRILKNLMSI
jgi:hypothetical protein